MRSVAVAVCALAVLVAACSPGSQDDPEAIADRDVPFQLLDTTTTTTVEPASPTSFPVTLYFAADDRLVPVERSVTDPPRVGSLLRMLLKGPTSEESRFGLTTAIPSGTRIAGVDRSDGTLVVRLSSDLATTDDNSTLAVAQLVLTASGFPSVDRIRFEVDGEPVQVPKGDGTLERGTVTERDYQELL